MEIERKFLIAELPDKCSIQQAFVIRQGYIFDQPEMRLRQYKKDYYLTFKGEGTLAREEFEVVIPEWLFLMLWTKTVCEIKKNRYEIEHGGNSLEIDEYQGSLAGIVILECEFPDLTAADQFILPDWVTGAIEVTANPAYKNKNLAKYGRPK